MKFRGATLHEVLTIEHRASSSVDRDAGSSPVYLSPSGEYRPFLEQPNLRALTAQPEYLLAMKCSQKTLYALEEILGG